jgi:hypothetical protein
MGPLKHSLSPWITVGRWILLPVLGCRMMATESGSEGVQPIDGWSGAARPAKKAKMSKVKYAAGENLMLFRVWDDTTKSWARCSGSTPNRKPDSILHRFARETGWLKDVHNEDTETARAIEKARQELTKGDAGKIKSHAQVVERIARLERFLLENHPTASYSVFLRRLLDLLGEVPVPAPGIQKFRSSECSS